MHTQTPAEMALNRASNAVANAKKEVADNAEFLKRAEERLGAALESRDYWARLVRLERQDENLSQMSTAKDNVL